MTKISHRDTSVPTPQTILQRNYAYTADDLPYRITESGTTTAGATVTFTYDSRRRLVHEVRTGASPYDLAYEYDAGGNRTVKVDNTDPLHPLRTEYTYDLSSPGTYKSNNNRLEHYEVYDMSGQAQTLLSTTWYYYTREGDLTYADIGNATRIVTKPEASAQYGSVRFGYAKNDRSLSFAVGETWEWDGNPAHCPTNYTVTFAREFRYDGARARYLNRQLNAQVFQQTGQLVSLADTWSDYDGDEAYGDFEVTPGNPPTVTNRRSYQPGLAQVDPWMSSGGSATDYVMTDHLGTTRGVIDWYNNPTDAAVYTAFGERISGTNHRFGYVGSFGYQASGEYPFLHVGARYYDPATGRFLQRDAIGIVGGVNVYLYSHAMPGFFIDPEGEDVMEVIAKGFLWITGGQGHVPVLDPGPAQDVVQTVAEIVSVVAPVGAVGGTITAGAKTVKAMKSTCIGRHIQKIRKYIRYDPAHHGKPPGWDGSIGKHL